MFIHFFSKTIVFISLLLCLALLPTSTESVSVADVCINKLQKVCRVINPEECQGYNKLSEFRALSDCCTGTCSFDEIKLACCAVL